MEVLKNHEQIDTYLNIFQDLKTEPVNLDLEIRCRDETVVTSSLLLVLSSGYLKDILSGVPNNYCIYLKDFNGFMVRKLIEFLSSGIMFCNDDVSEFHELIQNLGIKAGDITVEGIKHEFLDPEILIDEGSYEDIDNNYTELSTKNEEDCTVSLDIPKNDDGNSDEDIVEFCEESEKKYLNQDENPSYKIECNICHKTFKTMQIMLTHKLVHAKRRKFVCGKCGYTTEKKIFMIDHKKIHTADGGGGGGGGSYKKKPPHMKNYSEGGVAETESCEYCGKKFGKRYLKHHIASQHLSHKLECEICRQKFKTKEIMINHKLVHLSGAEIGKFVCDICGYAAESKDTLETHKLSHPFSRPHRCNMCDKSYINKASLESHILVHYKGPYKCEKCDRTFNDSSNRARHYTAVHVVLPTKGKSVPCPVGPF